MPLVPEGHRFREVQATGEDLVEDAFGVFDYQIVGLPAWAVGYMSERFNLDATFSSPQASSDQLRLMVRALLVERFGMKFHRESRVLPVYAMVIDPKGLKLKSLDGDKSSASQTRTPDGLGVVTVHENPNQGGAPATIHINSMVSLADTLTKFSSDRPVIDRTGLDGRFDTMPFANALPSARQFDGDPLGKQDNVAETLDRTLGLKLTPEKAPVDVVVIDSFSHPTPN